MLYTTFSALTWINTHAHCITCTATSAWDKADSGVDSERHRPRCPDQPKAARLRSSLNHLRGATLTRTISTFSAEELSQLPLHYTGLVDQIFATGDCCEQWQSSCREAMRGDRGYARVQAPKSTLCLLQMN